MSAHREDARQPRRPRIVIITASKHGSTAIVCEPTDDIELDGVDGVVIGSAAYLGRWMRSARRFVKRHAPELETRPVWIFSSGPVADQPEPGLDPNELERLMSRSGAIEHREFGGRLDMGLLGPVETLIANGVGVVDADRRDWFETAGSTTTN